MPNNSKFCGNGDGIYPIKLAIKETTYTDMYVSYLDIHLYTLTARVGSERNFTTN